MTLPTTARNWWDREAHIDERYATLAWGGDGTPEAVEPTMAAIIDNLCHVMSKLDFFSSAMEIGCGPGRILHRIARRYPDMAFIGIDVSDEMMALGAHDRPANVIMQLCDGETFPDIGQVDFIYSVEVFQHLAADTKRAYLREIRNALTPKGVALIQYVEGIDEDLIVNHPETEDNMKTWARDAGLKVKRITVPNRVHDEWRWMAVGL
jgi:cyclopropane fatty-acyl-phospholipid synthase-like methyltransferase